jgi:predicted house-cleaning noncanonical NTP pyrophosphatase (MazG superfamily)
MTEKLVRDRIEEIFSAEGSSRGSFRTARKDERWDLLVAKLHEEVGEFVEEPSADELGDVLEVLYALADEMALPWDELERVRVAKAAARGSFTGMAVWIDPEDAS